MIKVLHTSDWHLGRRFKGIDQTEWQRRALDWLCALIERERVDLLVVAGDVYDQPRPGTSAVRLLNNALRRLAGTVINGRPLDIVLTPGNHDSAERIGFGADVMRSNIHIRYRVEDCAEPVVVRRGDDAVAVYALPYLDPDAARYTLQGIEGLDEPIARSHEAVMGSAMRMIVRDLTSRREREPGMAAILSAHAFVTGAAPSDSERTIAVGGVDGVPAAMFSDCGINYLALGHLHRPQRVNIPRPQAGVHAPIARYSGSLLAYSFSEAPLTPVTGNGKSVVLFGLDSDGVHDLRTVPVESGQPAFVRLEGTMDDLLGPMADRHQNDWVSLTIDYTDYPRGMFQKLDARYPHALEKHPRCLSAGHGTQRTMADIRTVKDEMDVVTGFVAFMRGMQPSEGEREVLRQSVEHVRAAHAGEHEGMHGGARPGNENDSQTQAEDVRRLTIDEDESITGGIGKENRQRGTGR